MYGFEKACYVDLEGLSKGLVVLWKEKVWVKVIGKCKNLVDMEVIDERQVWHYIIFWVYGPKDFNER